MKVILNVDVKSLGEEGDVKNVANGYARNFLLPRNLAVPYNETTVALFEERKAEIEARKEQKRKDSASLKEKLESAAIEITMPAGANGKLYGAVTTHVIGEALKLYESQVAEIHFTVKAQEEEKKEEKPAKPARGNRFQRNDAPKAEAAPAETPAEPAAEEPKAEAPAAEGSAE